MAIRKVARMGHPVLRQKARPLTPEEIKSEPTRRLILDMVETMKEYGGIGIAAPQVHESIQLALIEISQAGDKYDDAEPQALTVLINPKITVLDKTPQGFWEGCLSVPELRGLVFRPRKVEVNYLDQNGKACKVVAEDFLATVFQHELDHLDGVLFVDKIEDRTQLAFLEEYQRHILPLQRDDIGNLDD